MLYAIWSWLGLRGVKVGLGLIAFVTIWDVLKIPIIHFYHYSVGWKGILLVWLGIGLIFKGRRIEQNRG